MSDKQDDAIQKDPAIQADAGEKDAPAEQKVEVDPRQKAFDAVVKQREETLAEDLGIDLEAGAPGAESEPDQPAPELKKEPQGPGEEMVEIVVHGKKSAVPKSKALEEGIRALQKESAADKSLQEAKTILEEVKKLREELSSKPAAAPAPEEDATDEMSNADLLYAIRYGEDDEANKAIEALRGTGRTVKPDEIDKAVEERLAAQTGKTILDTLNKPESDGGYADVMLNPVYKQYAGIKLDELVQAGEGSYNDLGSYQKAAEWVRTTILGKPAAAPAIKDPAARKLASKARMTVIQPASSTEANPSKTDEPVDPDTARRQTIAEMQRERSSGR